MIRINLLPHREQKRQARQRQFAAVLGAHGIAVTFAHCSDNNMSDI